MFVVLYLSKLVCAPAARVPISVRTEIGERTAENPSDRVLGLSLTAGGTPLVFPRLKFCARGFKRGFTPLPLGKQEIETVTYG